VDFSRRVWQIFKTSYKPIVAFEIWFSLLYAVLLAPLTAWLLNRLVITAGHAAITNEDLLAFLFSVRGNLFLLFGISFFLALGFLEQAGLMLVASRRPSDSPSSVRVLWRSMGLLPDLLRLGVYQAAGFAATALPFAAAGLLTYRLFLGAHDINYFLEARPWQLWAAVAGGGASLVLLLLVTAWLYVRWLFAVPLLVFENSRPLRALTSSWRRTRHLFRPMAARLAAWWLTVLTASVLTAWGFKALAGSVLTLAGLNLYLILPLVVVFLIFTVLADLACLTIGKAVHAIWVVAFYAAEAGTAVRPDRNRMLPDTGAAAGLRKWAWVGALAAFAAATAGGVAYVEKIDLNRRIEITAHRGSSIRAPENSLSALERAVEDGADYAEIDVQTTADGVVVVFHDADLMRMAEKALKIENTPYALLREIDIGSRFDPAFAGERVPTLEEAVQLARGRIRLNIEMKYNRSDPGLAGKVGRIIRQNDFHGQCVVTSLNDTELLKFKRLFPEIRTGLIVFRALGRLSGTAHDFLSLHAARAAPRQVARWQGKGKAVHVWTVNDLQTAISMIETGVDNIITDKPAFIRNLLRAWNGFSDTEKIALRLRHLFVSDNPQLVDEL
jgi:glycerophosphoryl diester phosphodiesterase